MHPLESISHLYIGKSVVDMHERPEKMSQVASQAIYGTQVSILDKSGLYTGVETPDKYQGWIKKSGLISRETGYLTTSIIGRVNVLWGHIFQTPDVTRSPPVVTLVYGTKVEVVSEKKDLDQRWVQVRLLNGKDYWAQSADFDFSGRALTLDEMLEESKKLHGIPYLWGGNSSFGYDCSGLVQTLFRQMGIQLPRDAHLQAECSILEKGVPDLRPGDLLFFGNKEEDISHVGVFLKGDEFLHSVTSIKNGPHSVQVGHFLHPVWRNLFRGRRRLKQCG